MPSIPLPEPLEKVRNKFNQIDSMSTPLTKKLNYLMILITIAAQFETPYYFLAFIPKE